MEMVDLRLRLGSSSGGGDDDEPSTASCNSRVARLFESSREYQQQITLLYDGRICACDVTEMQARAIIAMAKREMDGHMKKTTTQAHRQPIESSLPPSSPRPVERLLINPELSMKRSLQRFLHKRKSRLHALSPYGHGPQNLYSIKS
ncbi:protein TIFY 5A-like [Musa acuminata AAA Group]|uniref:protein TIFY 5A-like n=1 Tax=Musa acuminata AAA Group TaxID=214697 RepID=UPI0031D68CC4